MFRIFNFVYQITRFIVDSRHIAAAFRLSVSRKFTIIEQTYHVRTNRIIDTIFRQFRISTA